MKRIVSGVGVMLVAALGLLQTSHAAAAADFAVNSLHVEYYLGADKEGRSTLKTVETIVATVPTSDQERMLDRTIAKTYDGHPTSLAIVSVADQTGKTWDYTVASSGDNDIVRIVVPSHVSGQQTFVLTYIQRDVTKYMANPGAHEFAWQVNDTQWQQVVPKIDVTLHADSNIAPTLNKKVTCTVGSATCQITETGSTVTASTEKVRAGTAMDITVGFTAGTFRGYQPTLRDRVTETGPLVLGVGVVILLVGIAGFLYYRKKRR